MIEIQNQRLCRVEYAVSIKADRLMAIELVRKSACKRVSKRGIYTNRTALMQPSFSGWFVTCAYFPQTTCTQNNRHALDARTTTMEQHTHKDETSVVCPRTFPLVVTKPSSLTLTSMMVPFVMTPKSVREQHTHAKS